MRKLFVALLILSVMGGAFAQEWSFSAMVEVGGTIDFKADPVTAEGNNYNFDLPVGKVDVNYNNGAFSSKIGFNTNEALVLSATVDADNYKFVAETTFDGLVNGFSSSIKRLWGYSKMFDGLLHLEAAYKSADTNFWISSEVIGSVFGDKGDGLNFSYEPAGGWGFASVDESNYLLANFALDNLGVPLEVGFMLPDIFSFPAVEFADDVIGNMVIGAKLNMDPIAVALQFTPGIAKNGAIYLGATFGLGDLNLGAAFEGYLDDKFTGAFGLGAGYGAGDFNADAGFSLAFGGSDTVIGANVAVSYNIIADTLCLGLDAGMILIGSDLDFYLMPTLWYNFKGTGIANDYDSNDTAIILRYRFQKEQRNALDIAFKWSL